MIPSIDDVSLSKLLKLYKYSTHQWLFIKNMFSPLERSFKKGIAVKLIKPNIMLEVIVDLQ
ncbi:hypothetical protein EBS43_09300 [bacterium]|nr:hypothetical protein [bacterium]